MNPQLEQLLTQLDPLHYGLLGFSFLLIIILVISRSTGSNNADAVTTPDSVKPAAPADSVESEPQSAQVASTVKITEYSTDAALQVLGLLQQEARLIDFLQEEVQHFSDAEVGAAARVVHEGAKKVLTDNFLIEPIRSEDEESHVTLDEGFNTAEVRLSGNVVGKPPFTGLLIHRGWKVSEVKLPKVIDGHDLTIIAPAEVEL
ncbi:MAG: hypothetical protein COB04_07010 [Gammaproteobacteria bacterium]|nr:MAG: hypothetical protein COB04_07010 [Gammaproteobacteria bacterium]